ncbi:MAG: T9SS type A sorting domain-containing protein [Ignavibacteria bacterium]|nr:T9SS type A sorting domain-containing protein [Ignavibacteria bacterium]
MRKTILLCTAILMFGIASTCSSQIPNYIPKNGLTAWFPFNGNANDESGEGNHLTIDSATLTNDRFGKSNSAYSFDGLKSCLHREAIQNTDFTISVWVNLNTFPDIAWANAEFVSNGYGNANGYGIKYGTNTQGKNCVEIIVYGSEDNATLSSFVPDSNKWYHYVCSKSKDIYNLYINGILSSGGSFVSFPVKGYFVVGAVRGSFNDTGFSNFFNGQIDDIGFWNRALTTMEVKDIYNNSVVGVDEVNPIKSINIYPNPSTDNISVQLSDDLKADRFSITDYLGRTVLTGNLSALKTIINISDLASGVYLLQIGLDTKQTFSVVRQ